MIGWLLCLYFSHRKQYNVLAVIVNTEGTTACHYPPAGKQGFALALGNLATASNVTLLYPTLQSAQQACCEMEFDCGGVTTTRNYTGSLLYQLREGATYIATTNATSWVKADCVLSNNPDCCLDYGPCGVGQGDCDTDGQCETGLKCGTDNCMVYGLSPSSEYDCCYNATLNGNVPLFCNKNAYYQAGSTNKAGACDPCQGDCENDEDCFGSNVCYQRGGSEPVPGCSGDGAPGIDYCIPPSATPLSCRCDNGQPVVACTSEGYCNSCNNGYHRVMTTTTAICEKNVCSCGNGTPATGASCLDDNSHTCATCDPGFHKSEINNRCLPNLCACEYGTPFTGVNCSRHEANKCASCHVGYHIASGSNGIPLCEENKCHCSVGLPAKNNTCTSDGADLCQTCHAPNVQIGHHCYSDCTHSQVGQKVLSLDGGDRGAFQVSLSGDGRIMAVVGGNHNSPGGVERAGVAATYIYNGTQWVPYGQVVYGELAFDQMFASALNEDGSVLALGSWVNDYAASDAGQGRVFRFNSNTELWEQIGQSVYGTKDLDWVGIYIALDAKGNTMAIGGSGNAGQASVYHLEGNQWVQKGQKLSGPGGVTWFGRCVGLSADGNRLIVGAPRAADVLPESGCVYMYQFNGTAWVQMGERKCGYEGNGQRMGYSVAISKDGNTAIMGAHKSDAPHLGTFLNIGEVRVYRYNGTDWDLKFLVYGKEAEEIGWSVALNAEGNVMVFGGGGGFNEENNPGIIRVYSEGSDGHWRQSGPDFKGSSPRQTFGSVAISDDASRIMAGAHTMNGPLGPETGGATLYDVCGMSVPVINPSPTPSSTPTASASPEPSASSSTHFGAVVETLPSKSPAPLVVQQLPQTSKSLIWAFNTLLLLITAFMMMVVVAFWRTRTLQVLSPPKVLIFMMGCAVGLCGAYFLAFRNSVVFCPAYLYTRYVGFSLISSPLIVTHRLLLSAIAKSARGSYKAAWTLERSYLELGGLLFVQLCILIAAAVMHGLGYWVWEQDPSGRCPANPPYLLLTIVYMVMLVVCSFYAFRVRKAPGIYNDAKEAGLVAYNTLVLSSISVCLQGIQDTSNGWLLAQAVITYASFFGSLCIFFVPRLFMLKEEVASLQDSASRPSRVRQVIDGMRKHSVITSAPGPSPAQVILPAAGQHESSYRSTQHDGSHVVSEVNANQRRSSVDGKRNNSEPESGQPPGDATVQTAPTLEKTHSLTGIQMGQNTSYASALTPDNETRHSKDGLALLSENNSDVGAGIMIGVSKINHHHIDFQSISVHDNTIQESNLDFLSKDPSPSEPESPHSDSRRVVNLHNVQQEQQEAMTTSDTPEHARWIGPVKKKKKTVPQSPLGGSNSNSSGSSNSQ